MMTFSSGLVDEAELGTEWNSLVPEAVQPPGLMQQVSSEPLRLTRIKKEKRLPVERKRTDRGIAKK